MPYVWDGENGTIWVDEPSAPTGLAGVSRVGYSQAGADGDSWRDGYYFNEATGGRLDSNLAGPAFQAQIDAELPDLSHLSPDQQLAVAQQMGLSGAQLARMASTGKVSPGGALGEYIASAQHNESRSMLGSLAKGTGTHLGNIFENYRENPEQLLTAGMFGPAGSSLESDLWRSNDPAPSNVWGQPSETTYGEMRSEGIDEGGIGANRVIHNLGLAAGGAAAGAGINNALGGGAQPTYAEPQATGNPAFFDGAQAQAGTPDVPVENVYGPPDLTAPSPPGGGFTPEQIAQLAGGAGGVATVADAVDTGGAGEFGSGAEGANAPQTDPYNDPTYNTDIPSIPDGIGDAASWEQMFQQYPNLIRTGGAGLSSLLGYMGAREQRDDLRALADRQFNIGAPSRGRYEASFQPGFTLNSDPGFQNAMDTTMDTQLRRLSTTGNPFGNPGGLAEVNRYVMGNVALPQLNEYRRQNAGAGGLANLTSGAPGTAQAGIQAGGGMYDAIGYGIGQATQPRRQSLADYMRGLA